MTLHLPYETTGQELGETRVAMGKRLMLDIEEVVNKYKDKREKYYVLVHGKPYPNRPNHIKIKIIPMGVKPSMMLSCMLFGVDNQSGKLTLEWALPGSWPVWSVGGTNEPVPEVIASLDELSKNHNFDLLLPY